MNYILYIDTSTKNCSVALANGEKLVTQVVEENTRSHAKILQLLIDQVMQNAEISYKELKAIGVAAGPGSYTGLRIGMSAAKGLSFALDIPIMAFDTLENLAYTALLNVGEIDAVCMACMDSRNDEIYYALASKKFGIINKSQPAVIKDIRIDLDQKNKIYITGIEENKLKYFNFNLELLHLPHVSNAANYIVLGFKRFERNDFDNLIDIEPNYLKPFISKIF